MMIRIFLLQKAAIVIPVLYILLHQHLIFIGQAPPHIVVSCQSGNAIRHIEKRSFLCHLCKSPFIIRMKQDQIRLDPKFFQLAKPQVQIIPIGRHDPVHIPFSLLSLPKRINRRVILIVWHELREKQHAQLIKAAFP